MVLPMATKTPRIAVVDDDPFVLRGLRRLLRSAGFEVDTYASGAAFLNAGGDDEPDCVVLDLHMPQTTGFEVQAQLVKRGRSTPVRVMERAQMVLMAAQGHRDHRARRGRRAPRGPRGRQGRWGRAARLAGT